MFLIDPFLVLPLSRLAYSSVLHGFVVVVGGSCWVLILLHGALSSPHGGLLGCLLDMGVLPGTRSPLLLGFTQAATTAAVEVMHLKKDRKEKWDSTWILLSIKYDFYFFKFVKLTKLPYRKGEFYYLSVVAPHFFVSWPHYWQHLLSKELFLSNSRPKKIYLRLTLPMLVMFK